MNDIPGLELPTGIAMFDAPRRGRKSGLDGASVSMTDRIFTDTVPQC
jgi:hypothetical protein